MTSREYSRKILFYRVLYCSKARFLRIPSKMYPIELLEMSFPDRTSSRCRSLAVGMMKWSVSRHESSANFNSCSSFCRQTSKSSAELQNKVNEREYFLKWHSNSTAKSAARQWIEQWFKSTRSENSFSPSSV